MADKTVEDKLDAIFDSISKRMDAADARLDAACSRMDSFAKKDAEKDAEAKAKKDAEDKEAEEKAQKDAAEKEEAAKKDAAEAAKKDAAEKEEQAKKDAAPRAPDTALATRLADIEKRLPPQLASEDRQRFVTAQFKAEPVYQAFGDSAGAPAFLNGEALPDYQRRLLTKVKQHSPRWKDKDLSRVDASVLDIAEEQIYADAMQAALHPTDLPVGVLREIKKIDEANRVVRHFVSNDEAACWRQFGTPGGARLGCINANVGKTH
jgi:hypothetical protein